MRRVRPILDLLARYALTQCEWAELAVAAAREARMEEPDLTDLRRNLALARRFPDAPPSDPPAPATKRRA